MISRYKRKQPETGSCFVLSCTTETPMMAFLFSKAAPPIIQMKNPLYLDHNETMLPQTEMGMLQSPKGKDSINPSLEDPIHVDRVIEDTSSASYTLQYWSVDDVVSWLQENVPYQSEHMQDYCRAFRREGIDGMGFLTLQRNSGACSSMTDSDWLLLHNARESLLSNISSKVILSGRSTGSSPSTPKAECMDDSSSLPSRSNTSRNFSMGLVNKPEPEGFLWSSLKFLSFSSKNLWSPTVGRAEEKDSTMTHVFSLQDEILSAEEREDALKAKMDNLDEILRTAQLASYLYTRMRWTPLPGELPLDDFEVDDWIQRFLVLEGSTLFFFPRAADLRPEGAIVFSDIVETGQISGKIQHDEEDNTWFGFHVTTCNGLRLECATSIKLQADLWMSLIRPAGCDRC